MARQRGDPGQHDQCQPEAAWWRVDAVFRMTAVVAEQKLSKVQVFIIAQIHYLCFLNVDLHDSQWVTQLLCAHVDVRVQPCTMRACDSY